MCGLAKISLFRIQCLKSTCQPYSHHTLQEDDGFYTGQVGEAFGLVPSNFLQKEEKKETMSTKQAMGETKEIEKWYVRI